MGSCFAPLEQLWQVVDDAFTGVACRSDDENGGSHKGEWCPCGAGWVVSVVSFDTELPSIITATASIQYTKEQNQLLTKESSYVLLTKPVLMMIC